MSARTYKKYMKKKTTKDYTLWKLFVISFLGMLLVFTFAIKSFSPTVDVSIGEYSQEDNFDNTDEIKKRVDGRLAIIQEEDQGRSFSELMRNAERAEEKTEEKAVELKELSSANKTDNETKEKDSETTNLEPVFKVFIGTYTSAEQAKVAKDIILESGSNYNPIIKCIGSNNYTLQVGLFKNKNSAEALLYTIQQSHLPGRIVQEY
jgi:hypothetical protein